VNGDSTELVGDSLVQRSSSSIGQGEYIMSSLLLCAISAREKYFFENVSVIHADGWLAVFGVHVFGFEEETAV
jgi:hypothetical protein